MHQDQDNIEYACILFTYITQTLTKSYDLVYEIRR